jgi:hypothetical protein
MRVIWRSVGLDLQVEGVLETAETGRPELLTAPLLILSEVSSNLEPEPIEVEIDWFFKVAPITCVPLIMTAIAVAKVTRFLETFTWTRYLGVCL